jgi:hypothetical protein
LRKEIPDLVWKNFLIELDKTQKRHLKAHKNVLKIPVSMLEEKYRAHFVASSEAPDRQPDTGDSKRDKGRRKKAEL